VWQRSDRFTGSERFTDSDRRRASAEKLSGLLSTLTTRP
jgi:hypothetical protein